MLNLSDTEVAWLAGLLEGEGCFALNRSSKPQRRDQAYISLHMTDKDVVQRAADLMGRKGLPLCLYASRKKGWAPCFKFSVYGAPALEIMRLVRPYMGQRRGAKIDEILARTDLSHMPRNTTKGVTLSA